MDISNELATKVDIAGSRLATKADIAALSGKIDVQFVVTIAVILFVNKDAVVMIGYLLDLILINANFR